MSKRFLSLVLALVMVLGTLGTAVFAAGPTDNEKVNWLIDQGIVTGNEFGDYMLDKTIDRASVAKMVVEALDLKAVAAGMQNYKTAFKDVPVTHWSNGNINVVSGRGLMIGNAGNFMPGNQISYAEVVTILVRMLDGLTADEEKAAVWPTTYIAKAYEMGILDGVTVASYQEPAVREAILEMFYNAMVNMEVGNYTVVKAIVLENYRVENLKKDEVVVEVIRELQKADYAEKSRLEKGDQRAFTIDAKVGDVENLLGKVVDLTLDRDGNVVKVQIDNSYKYEVGAIEATDSALYIDGTRYTVLKDERYNRDDERIFTTYFNNDSLKYVDFVKDIEEAEYARVTIKNGRVLFIDSFQFADIAPVKETRNDGKQVYVYNDANNGATKRLDFNARTKVVLINGGEMKVAELTDIKAMNVIHVTKDNTTVFVRTDAEVVGTYERARSATLNNVAVTSLYVDGEAYNALTRTNNRRPVYTLNFEDYQTLDGATSKVDLELAPFKDKEVTLLVDMNDNVQYISAEVKATYFYGLITRNLAGGFEIAKADGTKERYAANLDSDFYALNAAGTTLETKESAFEFGDLVRVELTEDEDIATLVKLADKETDNWETQTVKVIYNARQELADLFHKDDVVTKVTKGEITFDNLKAHLTSKTMVFLANEGRGTTMADVVDNYAIANVKADAEKEIKEYNVKAYMAYEDVGGGQYLAKAIVFTNLERKTPENKDLIVKVVSHEYKGTTSYLVVTNSSGEETTVTMPRAQALGVERNDIIKLTVRKADETVGVKVEILIDASEAVVYQVKQITNDGRRINFENGESYWKHISLVAFNDIEAGDRVVFKLDDGYIRYIDTTTRKLTEKEETKSDGKLAYDYKVGDARIRVNVDGTVKSYNVLEGSLVLDMNGDEIEADTIIAKDEKVNIVVVEGTDDVDIITFVDYEVEVVETPGELEVEDFEAEYVEFDKTTGVATVTVPNAKKNELVGEVSVTFNKEVEQVFIDGVDETTRFEDKFEYKDGIYTATIVSSWSTLIGDKTEVTVKVVDVDGNEVEITINLVIEEPVPVTVAGIFAGAVDSTIVADEVAGYSIDIPSSDMEKHFSDIDEDTVFVITLVNGATFELAFDDGFYSNFDIKPAEGVTLETLEAAVVTLSSL